MNQAERDELLVRVDERVAKLVPEMASIKSRVSSLELWRSWAVGGLAGLGSVGAVAVVVRFVL